MILDALIFALGFFVAGLLALAALPAVWRRALRLSEERLSRLVPLSADEIAAERDHLRAAHAVALRRAEQKLEGSEADRAALRVEAARREARIATLDDAAIRAQVRIASLEAGAADLRREVAGLWAEHGAEAVALDGLAGLAEARLEQVAALQAERNGLREERDALRHDVDRSRGSVAGLETRLIGAEARGGDLERELSRARRDATAAAERLARATAEREAATVEREAATVEAPPRDGHGAELDGLRAELAFMAEQARSAERRAADSARAYETLRAERDGATAGSRDDAALRVAIAALAEEVLRSTDASQA